jgi:hypothetical protein
MCRSQAPADGQAGGATGRGAARFGEHRRVDPGPERRRLSGREFIGHGRGRGRHCSAPPAADPSLWSGLPAAKVDAATTSTNGALAAGGGATQELRIGAGAPGTTASGMQPADGAAGGPGQRDTGRQDGGRRAAAAPAATRLAAAASNAEPIATGNTAADRFALPRARVPDSALPGLAGGLAPHRTDASPAATVALATPLAAPDFAKALARR